MQINYDWDWSEFGVGLIFAKTKHHYLGYEYLIRFQFLFFNCYINFYKKDIK